MSADNHANYAKIGFAVLLGVVAIAVALVFIAGVGDSRNIILAETYYDSSVSGLSVGSPVNFRGVKIGEVRRIDFVGNIYPEASDEDSIKVYIEMALDARIMGYASELRTREQFRQDMDSARGMLRATVTASGITGLSRIEIGYPAREFNDAPLSWKPRNVLFLPAPSLLEGFSVAATKLLNQLQQTDLGTVWSNVNTIAVSLASLSSGSYEMFEEHRETMSSTIRNANELCGKINELAAELKENPSLLFRPNDPEPLPETAY